MVASDYPGPHSQIIIAGPVVALRLKHDDRRDGRGRAQRAGDLKPTDELPQLPFPVGEIASIDLELSRSHPVCRFVNSLTGQRGKPHWRQLSRREQAGVGIGSQSQPSGQGIDRRATGPGHPAAFQVPQAARADARQFGQFLLGQAERLT